MKDAKYYRCLTDGALGLVEGVIYPANTVVHGDGYDEKLTLYWFMVYGFHKEDFKEAQEWEYAEQCACETDERARLGLIDWENVYKPDKSVIRAFRLCFWLAGAVLLITIALIVLTFKTST